MAKRNDPVARARGRKPAPVKKPFPVGFVVGCVALALFLGSIITYAVINTGEGDTSSLKYAQKNIDGLQNSKDLSRDHLGTAVDYPDEPSTPPVGGKHNETWQSCQVYSAPIANERAIHSLEHGAVWVTYDPAKLSDKDVAALKKLVDGDPKRMMSPYPGLKSAISLQAWGEQLFVDKVSDKRVERFLDLFTNGPQSPERNASCEGSTATGPLAPAPTAPSPTAPAPTPSK